MTLYKTLTGLQDLFKSVVRPKSSGDFFAWLGNAQGRVVADDNSGVYIMDWNGNVRVVMNNKVPPYPFRPVRVGYVSETNKVLEVKEFVDAYPSNRPAHVPNHAGNHEWGGVDTMFIRGEQILPGVAIPDDDDPLVLHVAGFVYYLNGWHIIDSFTLDVTSYIPAAGAKFLLLEADDAGAITVQSGTAVDVREELVMEDIPQPSAGKVPLVAVMVYAGQVQIWKTLSKQDVVDLRWSRYATGLDTSITAPLYAGRHVAATDPTVTDDDTAGFLPLHLWLNSTSGDRFICTDNSTGAAVWDALTGGGGGAASDYITGLKISFVSTTSISVGIGSAYVDGDILTVSSALTVSSITAVDDIYHVYLYDNSGTPAIDLSTTDPASAAYFGTARTKNGDTSRRYLGSVLCTSAGGVQPFSHLPNSGYMSYTNVAVPKRVVSGGTATTKSTVSVAGATPPTATAIQILAINTSTNANLFIVDAGDINFLVVPATLRAAATAPLDGVNIYYKMSTAPSGGSTFVDVLGYYFER